MGAARFLLPAALAGLVVGIVGADGRVLPPPVAVLAAGILLAGAAAVGGRRAAPLAIAAVVLVAAVFGAWRWTATAHAAIPAHRSVASLAGADARLAGTVVDDPRPRADRLQLVVGEIVATDAGGTTVSLEDRALVWLPRGIDIRSGDRVSISGRAELAQDFDGFAYREYLARQGIGAIIRAREADVLGTASHSRAHSFAALRRALLDGLNRLVPEPEAALGAGIVLGVRSAIAPEINDAFATAGLTHVVAISGWNIAIVSALVMSLVRPLERRRGGKWLSACAATASVAGYVVLAGASPSVVRAALMAGAVLLARLSGSRAHATSALALAAVVMLIAAPSVLWDVGFQLSLLATAGLVWFGRWFEARLARWPVMIREPVALTLAAQVTTLPVILVNFERLSLVAPLANVLVVPLVPLAMAASATAAVGGVVVEHLMAPVADAAAWLLGGTAWLALRAMIAVGHATAAIPVASVEVSLAPPFAIAWYPLIVLAAWAVRPNAQASPPQGVPDEAMTGALGAIGRVLRPGPAAVVLVAALGAISVSSAPDGRLHVTVLDIGQGDAVLVETPTGRTMLVDGGPDPELTLRRLGANLPFSERTIDVVVVTHPHQDHVAGLVEVLDRYRVGLLLHAGIPFENAAYDRLLADAAAEGVDVRLARAGDRLVLDAVTSLDVVYPDAAEASAPLPDGDINNGSIVAVLRHGGFSALLTGDAKAPVEAKLVAGGRLPGTDVLKVGHHGSSSSTTPTLLAATRPSVAVISAGKGNEYGHPTEQTLSALATVSGIAVHRTDLDGDVEIVADARTYRVRTDAGWAPPRPTRAAAGGASIGPWQFPIARPFAACSTTPACPTASASTPRGWLAWQWPPPAWSPRAGFRSTAGSLRPRRCCMTSTSPRSVAPAASTASSARGAWRRRASTTSPCRSPPTRSRRSWTRTDTRSAGRR